MAASGAHLRSILLIALVAPALASSSTMKRARFLETPPTEAPAQVILRDSYGEAPQGNLGPALRSSQQATSSFSSESDAALGDRQLRLLGSATAAVSAVQQPTLEDPVRAFYRGLANPDGVTTATDAQAQQPPQDLQPPLPTLSPWGASGASAIPTLPPVPMPLGGLPPAGSLGAGTSSRTGTDVKAKMGELNTAVNNVLNELTQQLEQQQRFAMEKEEALEKEQAQVQTLTQENMQLGSQVAQLQASRVGMVEDAKSLSDDVQTKLATWISKYESRAVAPAAQAQGPAALPPVQL
jgi:hypothetical protein